jgi:hypothetical protein
MAQSKGNRYKMKAAVLRVFCCFLFFVIVAVLLVSGFFGVTGVLTQGFTPAKQALYCLSHISNPFCSGYFGDGVSNYLPGLAKNHDPPECS